MLFRSRKAGAESLTSTLNIVIPPARRRKDRSAPILRVPVLNIVIPTGAARFFSSRRTLARRAA